MEDKEKNVLETPEEELTEKTEAPKEEKHKKKKKESIEDKLEAIEEELQEIKDKYFRTLAEGENMKKRLSDDLKRERTYGAYSLADKLIDSIEVFDQALGVQTDDPNFKNFLYGFRMIKDMFMNALKDEGVSLIETKEGDVFDPQTEHAVDTTHDANLPDNTIVKIVKKGYKFKDRLLRPAMVVINLQPQEETKTEQEKPAEDIAQDTAQA